MEFLNPIALFLLPLAGLPFLLRHQQRPKRTVSGLFLWRAIDPRDAAKPTARRFRRNWLAMVQAAFILTALGALARPSVPWLSPRAVFIVDVSASMGARQGQATRLELAVRQALQASAGLPAGSTVRAIAAGATPQDLGVFPAHSGDLRRVIGDLRTGAGQARLLDAMELGHTSDPGADVWVFTDLPVAGLPPSMGPNVQFARWIHVGDPVANVAVSALAARRTPAAPRDAQVVIELSNHGPAAREVVLAVDSDGREVAREDVHLDAHDARTLTRRVANSDGIVAARLLSAGDALGVDNQRVTLVPTLDPIRVLLISAGNLFLEKALTANPSLRVTIAAPGTQETAAYDVVVCDSCSNIQTAAVAAVLTVAAPAESATPEPVTVAIADHPLVRGFDTGGASAAPTPPLRLEGGEVVLRAGNAPLLSAGERDGHRVAVLNLDMRSNAFPLTTAFPVLIANTMEWLSGRGENAHEIVAGEPLSWMLRARPDAAAPTVTGPDGRSLPFRMVNGRLTVSATGDPGVYTVRGQDISERFVVNPATDTESDVSQAGQDDRPSSSPAAPTTVASERGASEYTTGLLVVALALFGVEWWRTVRLGRRTRIWWRVAVVATLVLAIDGLRVPSGQGRATVIFALDRSDSIPLRSQRSERARLQDIVRAMRGRDEAGIVVFGSDAAVDRRPSTRLSVTNSSTDVSSAGTNIEAGLRLARQALPPEGGRRIALFSDGRQTTGDALREGALAAAAGIHIDVAPLDPGAATTLPPAIQSLRAPADVRAGEPFLLSAVVEARPRSRVPISIQADGQARRSLVAEIGVDGTGNVETSDRLLEPGVHFYRARLDGEDVDDSPVGAVVTVSGTPSLLYVTGSDDAQLGDLLSRSGFHVVRTAPASVPVLDAAFATFEAVVLDDVPPDALNGSQTAALARYVEQAGGGLLLLGSSRSLDSVGYQSGALGSILPVDFRPRPGIRSPAAAFVLVFDKSGSMADRVSGVQKIELARQAVLRVLDIIPATDSLGVVAFDSQPLAVAPLRSAHDAQQIGSALRRIEPAGSTAIAPALDLATKWLQQSPEKLRHVLLVSDGRTSPGDADRLRAIAAERQFELSVVAIGTDADRVLMQQLAEQTGGHAYFPDDIRQLPQIAARDAARSRGGAIVQARFTARAPAQHPVLTGIGRNSLPVLNGYVVGAAKAGADAILSSHLDDPILAGWRAGLGRVGVFTADLGSPWSSSMRQWPAYATFWAQTVRWLSRRSVEGPLRAELTESDDGVKVVVETAGDTTPDAIPDLRYVQATVRSPSGELQQIRLRPVAPGRFEGRIEARQAGPYNVVVSALDAKSSVESRVLRGFYWSSDRERRTGGTNRELLAQLAAMTGGTVLTHAANPFTEPRPADYREARSTLTAAALLLFLIQLMRGRGFSVSEMRRWWHDRGGQDAPHQAAA